MKIISSLSSLLNFERENVALDNLFKRYALIYETVIFNRWGAPIGSNDPFKTVAEFLSVRISSNKNDFPNRMKLAQEKAFRDIFVDCWDIVPNAENFEKRRRKYHSNNEHNDLSQFCFKEIRRQNALPADSFEFDINDVNVLAADLRDDVSINLLAESEGFGTTPNYSPLIERAYSNEISSSGSSLHELFENGILIPDFGDFSWSEILELRNDPTIKQFREIVFKIIDEDGEIDSNFTARIQKDLWNLAKEIKPDIKKSFLSAIATNIPSSFLINPCSVYSFVKEIHDERKMLDKYGHVFFIQRMRDCTEEK